jgi:hypothetical protein
MVGSLRETLIVLARQCENQPAIDEELSSLLDEALEHSNDEDMLQTMESLLPWPNAAELVARRLLRHSVSPEVLLRLGHWFWMLGNDEFLEQALEKARTEMPSDHPHLLHLRAQTLSNPEDRLAAYQQIIELYPQDRTAWEAILGLTR